MPPMETARPQANGIIGMVNGEPEPEEEKSIVLEQLPPTAPADSVSEGNDYTNTLIRYLISRYLY